MKKISLPVQPRALRCVSFCDDSSYGKNDSVTFPLITLPAHKNEPATKNNLTFEGVFVKPILLKFQKPLLLLSLPAALLLASSATFAAEPATLSFNIAARVQAGSGQDAIVRSTNGLVRLRGQQSRIETKLGEQSVVVLFLKPYVYRLLPKSKSGVRYKSSTPSPELQALGANWVSLLNQPGKIRAELQKKGAKKTGSATLNKTAVDVYSASRWDGKARKVKLWLRRSDSLPLRMESSADGVKILLNWSNYRRGQKLSPALFSVPKGYKIRESQAPRAIG